MSLDINLTGVEITSNKKTTLTDNSDTFYPTQKAVKTAVDLKVDKIAGKGLSENDFTNTLKTKLDGIQDGAEVNVNADWNATSGDAQILNKPTIPSVTGLVPYTGATGDVDLGEFELKAGQVELDQTPTGTSGVAVMRWNDTDGTIDLGLKGGNVTLQVGQEQVLRVVNKTATNVNLLEANYQAVRVTGAQGQRLKVDLAQATTDALSAETIGLVTETINNNQEGFITTSGIVRNINTTGSLQSETWADGDIVYLSPTTAGRITNIKPSAPNHLIIIGYVISAHATQGSIFVKVDNGYELDELHNVAISTPLNNQSLVYETATTLWKNKSVTTADVADSTNKRYVTDAQLVVIGNTSNTNTGDETQASILSKLGWIRKLQKSGTVTGTTSETLVHTFSFSANEYPASSILHIESQFIRTGTPSANGTIRFKINTSNTIVGSTLIGQASIGGNTNLYSQPRRKFDIEGGLIQGLVPNSSLITDIVTSTSTPLSVSLDTTQNWWLFVTYQAAGSGDTAICNFTEVKNF